MPNISCKNIKLVCPVCRKDLTRENEVFMCSSCGHRYPIVDSIPDFRQSDEYWCNVSRDKMQLLNRMARETNNWFSAAKSVVPEYMGHFDKFNRADAQFVWPITKGARILDAGSMWGGLTIPVAQYAEEVFAVDKTLETLSFLNIRASQMGYDNIYPLAATLDKLPFVDAYFDLVILNGVLEWVAFRDNIILEKYWNDKVASRRRYTSNPKGMQIQVLRELQRITKPEGYLILAIENRMGYQYLTGYPDDHVNIRFVAFLPRKLADIITRIKKGFSYRTYIYSSIGYKNILLKAGYRRMKFYGVFPHYISPNVVIPFNVISSFKKLIISGGGRRLKLFFSCVPSFFIRWFSPSFLIVAGKSETVLAEARIINLIKKTGILDGNLNTIEPVIISNRPDTGVPLKCLIYDTNKKRPILFCKISRAEGCIDALKNEAVNFNYANNLFKDRFINKRIPKMLFFGTIDGVSILITDYIDCVPFDFERICRNHLAKLDKAVKSSIDFLVEFQNCSVTREVKASEYLSVKIKEARNLLNGAIDTFLKSQIDELIGDLALMEGVKLKLCAVHGDFDFYHNILHKGREIYAVDFEHFEKEGSPFLDLIMLIFHPFLMEFKRKTGNETFISFLEKTGALGLLKDWIEHYFTKSGTDRRLLRYVIKIGVLEQNAKEYPYYRNGKTFPLNDIEILKQLFNIF